MPGNDKPLGKDMSKKRISVVNKDKSSTIKKDDKESSKSKKKGGGDGISAEQLDKILKEHEIIMEILAKIEIFGKKFDR